MDLLIITETWLTDKRKQINNGSKTHHSIDCHTNYTYITGSMGGEVG